MWTRETQPKPPSRVGRLAGVARRLGVLAALERVPHRASLLVVNYHCVGDAQSTRYDRAVIEASADEFHHQVTWLKRHFELLTLQQAQDYVDHPSRLKETAVLVTFDDGYRDNYEVAFPILKSLGVSGTFFLPTAFVGTNHLPWWDRIAELVRRRGAPSIELRFPAPAVIDGEVENRIRRILRVYKSLPTPQVGELLADLERACEGALLTTAPERRFLDWEEAREMLAAAMCFGSHTHRHELLARQGSSEQRDELVRSRAIIREHLGIACDALAYPVGSRNSFNEDTREALRAAGYRTAFSYYGGVNLARHSIDPYNVLRIPTDAELSFEAYRLRALLASTLGRQWP